MSCPNNNSDFSSPEQCNPVPNVYTCPDDGTFLYNQAKRLRWFAYAQVTSNCPANTVGDAVTGRASVTSTVSQSAANAAANAQALAVIAATQNCVPLFWTSTQTYVWQCSANPAVTFAVTMTAPSFVSQLHANAKAYALAYQTAKDMADANCCGTPLFSYTATFTATCSTGPSNPFASSTAVVTATSCVSALEAQQLAQNNAETAAGLGLSCTYAADQNLAFMTSFQQCEDGEDEAYERALAGEVCPPNALDPCKCGEGAFINEEPPNPIDIPCQQVCWLRQCGEIVGVTLFGCNESPPAGAVPLATKKVSFQVCNVINGNNVCETVSRVMYIWVLNLPEPNPPGCNPCVNGYGLISFLYSCTEPNTDCNVLGFYCCGHEAVGAGFCRCYSPCCLGEPFCVEY